MHTAEPVDMMLSYLYLQDAKGSDQLATLRMIESERAGDPPKLTRDRRGVVGLHNPVNCREHYLDSGAFTQRKEALKYHKKTGKGEFAFYRTKKFWRYVDEYSEFVKQHPTAIDYFSVVDVIPNPELTWEVQEYTEKEHGIRPVPVVHYPADLKWLRHYVREGHELIAVGGISGKTKKAQANRWLDQVFAEVCKPPLYTPSVRLHGFGLSRFDILHEYPWWSTDSSTWTTTASYGGIFVPLKRGGRFAFDIQPPVVRISHDSPDKRNLGAHFLSMSGVERRHVGEWLDVIGVPLGGMHDGDIKTYGVMTRHSERRACNYEVFKRVWESVPPYPWAWKPTRIVRGGLGLT